MRKINITQILFRYAKENNCVKNFKDVINSNQLISTITPEYKGKIALLKTLFRRISYSQLDRGGNPDLLFKYVMLPFIISFIRENNLIQKINLNLKQQDNKFRQWNTLNEYYNYIITSEDFDIVSFFSRIFFWNITNEGYDFWMNVDYQFQNCLKWHNIYINI